MRRRINTKDDFFERQEEFKQWFLYKKNDLNSNEIHREEFIYWIDNIIYALNNKTGGIWTYREYQEHMIRVAKQVVLSNKYICEMEYDLKKWEAEIS